MPVYSKPTPALQHIIIKYPKCAKIHAVGIVVASKAESMVGIEPTMVDMPSLTL